MIIGKSENEIHTDKAIKVAGANLFADAGKTGRAEESYNVLLCQF